MAKLTMDDGTSLAVEATGSGPGLLLVHGFGGAKEDFSDHVEDLGRDHTVVVFDHRGHGASDQPESVDAYSVDRLVLDALAIADEFGFSRFRILGHSMGGMVARRLVLGHPDRVDALVLMDTSPGPPPSIDRDLMEAACEIVLTEGKDVLKPLLDAAAVLETPAYQRLLVERPGYREFCDSKWDALSGVMWGAIGREIVRQPDELARMAEIRCPTLVIVGDQDEPFLAPSQDMAETIPGATFVVVPDAGHSPQFENPAVWSAAMHEFLGSVVATA